MFHVIAYYESREVLYQLGYVAKSHSPEEETLTEMLDYSTDARLL